MDGVRWLTRRTARTRGEHAEARTLTANNVPAVMLRSTSAGVAVTPNNALGLVDAWACVRVLAQGAAALPLVPYRRTSNGRERAPGGPLGTLLDRPAPGTTQAALIGAAVVQLATWGNAYVGKYRAPEGAVSQLGLLAPERMVVELRAGEPVYTYTDERGRQMELSRRDLIHVRGLSADGVMGLSPVTQAREALGLSGALSEQASRTLANDSRPSGILRLGQGSAERIQGIADAWRSRHGGPENAGRIAVVTGEVEFVSVSMSAVDAQFLEQRELSTREVCRIWGVPPEFIGASSGDSMTYANVESRNLAFVQHTLRPSCLVPIEQAFSADEDLCPPGSGLYVEFLLDALLRADSATRAQVYTQALNPETGWMTRAEVRRLENLQPEAVADAA